MNKDELSALQKFALLPNINIFEEGKFKKVDKEQDEGYTPTLYYYNKSYQLEWIDNENISIFASTYPPLPVK